MKYQYLTLGLRNNLCGVSKRCKDLYETIKSLPDREVIPDEISETMREMFTLLNRLDEQTLKFIRIRNDKRS